MEFILLLMAIVLNLRLPIYYRDVLAEKTGIPEEKYLKNYLIMVYISCVLVMVTGVFIQIHIVNETVWYFDPLVFIVMYILSIAAPVVLIKMNIEENNKPNAKWKDPTSIKPLLVIILILIIGFVYFGNKYPENWGTMDEMIKNTINNGGK